METPWGNTEELRADRLRPGPQPDGRERTIAHQRRRLLAAMVEATAERGYAATSVADLARLSGVGTGAFYNSFASKEDCFLTAVEALYATGMARVEAGYRGEQEWEDRIRAAFRELVELLVSQPAAARMCFVDVYAAGAAGPACAERGASGFERLLRPAIGDERAGLPEGILAGAVRGIQMLIHDRLRRDAVEELPTLIEELVRWGLGYRTPPVALRRPAHRVAPRLAPPSRNPVERLLVALAEAVAEKGYQAVSVNELAPRAGTSMRTLYDNFSGKEDAFLACLDWGRTETLEVVGPCFETAPDWPRGIAAANEALCRHLAARPALARTMLVEVLGGGPRALQDRDEAIKRYATRLRAGYELGPEVPSISAEAIAFGRYALLQRQIARHGAQSLPRLAPTLTFFVLSPFLGGERAAEIANQPFSTPGREAKVAVEATPARTTARRRGQPRRTRR